MMSLGHDVTDILLAWSDGDEQARDRLFPLVYKELRRQADLQLRKEQPGHTLQPTALVHELYMRLVDQSRVRWKNRLHFYRISAEIMRRILVDHARGRNRTKRGGNLLRVSVVEALGWSQEKDGELIALDDALKNLEQIDRQQARIVVIRFFAGLTIAETAEVLGISPATVKRKWELARSWLYREVRRADNA